MIGKDSLREDFVIGVVPSQFHHGRPRAGDGGGCPTEDPSAGLRGLLDLSSVSTLHRLAHGPLVNGGFGCRPQPTRKHVRLPAVLGKGVHVLAEVVWMYVVGPHHRDVHRLLLLMALDVFLGCFLQMFLGCLYCI
jgi:hypothetical protein